MLWSREARAVAGAMALVALMGVQAMPVSAAELGELSLQEKNGRFLVHRNGLPLEDERFLYLLESKRVDPNFTYHARRNQLSTDYLHAGGTVLAAWFAYLGYTLISRGSRMQAVAIPDNPDLTDTSNSIGRYYMGLGVQFAVASALGLATWLYQPRAFEVGAAQDAVEAYNHKFRAERPRPTEFAPIPPTPAATSSPTTALP